GPVEVRERRGVGDDEAVRLGDADRLGDQREDAVLAAQPAAEAEAQPARRLTRRRRDLLQLADQEVERLARRRVLAGLGEDLHAVARGRNDRVAERLAVADAVEIGRASGRERVSTGA